MAEPKRIFLSYARADDEPFVKRLFHDLTDRGFNVWWDRISMPSRDLTFLQEIRDAIEACDRLLAVVGPKAVESDYVRSEWQHGLLFAKGVVPIMRLGERQLLPAELRKLHCPDFREERPYDEALDELLRILAEHIPPLGPLLTMVPALPPHFLLRQENFYRLKDLVLADVQRPTVVTSAQQVTGLWGMGGSGKSVLAASLARSTETRRSFLNGILWIPVGQEGDLLQELRQVGVAFKDEPHYYLELVSAKNRLPKVLADKLCLIVLDDVWQLEQVEPLVNALGPRCRLLITTRNAGLVNDLGAQELPLEVLSDPDALTLLAGWKKMQVKDLPSEAVEVAKECGNLPLALSLCGSMAGGGISWSDLLDALREADLTFIEARLPNYPFPNVFKTIQVSVDFLEQEKPGQTKHYRELAVFPAGDAVPVEAVVTLWQQSDGLKERDARKLLADLHGKALLKLHGQEPHRLVTLHDLQVDYLRAVAGENLGELHKRLLAAYQKKCTDGWPTGPNDGYFFEHLAHHLRLAGHSDELLTLLTESPDWMNAQFAARKGDDAHVADLERSLADYADSTAPETSLAFIKLLTARQVVKTRVSIYKDEDLKILAYLGREDEAQAHVRLRDKKIQQFAGLRIIYEILSEQGRAGPGWLNDLCDAAYAVRDGEERADVMRQLAILLHNIGDHRFVDALESAREAALKVAIPGDQAIYLRSLGAVLVDLGYPDRAIEVTQAINHFWSIAPALYGLARSLDSIGDPRAAQFRKQSQEFANQMWVDNPNPRNLVNFAIVFAQTGCFEKAREVINAIPEIFDEKEKVLLALARALAGEEHFELALEAGKEYARLSVFSPSLAIEEVVTALIKAKRLDEAEKAIRSLLRPLPQVKSLLELAVALDEAGDKRAEALLSEASDTIQNIKDEETKAYRLQELAAAQARAGHFEEAERTVHAIAQRWDQAMAWREVALAMAAAKHTQAQTVFEIAQKTAQLIDRPHSQAKALLAMTVFYSEIQAFDIAFKLASEIKTAEERAAAMLQLAQALKRAGDNRVEHTLDKAWEAARSTHLGGFVARVQELIKVALAFKQSGDNRAETVFAEARQSVHDLASTGWFYLKVQVEALSELGRVLAQADNAQAYEVFDEALALAKAIKDENMKNKYLKELVSTFVEVGFLDRADQVVQTMQNDRFKANALQKIAIAHVRAGDNLSKAAFEASYRLAKELDSEYSRSNSLKELVLALVEAKQFERAQAIVPEIEQEREKAESQHLLASALAAGGQIDQALAVARAIAPPDRFVKAFGDIACVLIAIDPGGASALVDEAWKVARLIEYPKSRAQSLCALATSLAAVKDNRSAKLFEEAWKATKEIELVWRIYVLTDLASAMVQAEYDQVEKVLGEAKKVASGYEQDAVRSEYLNKLADVMAKSGRLSLALSTVNPDDLDMYLQKLAEWLLYQHNEDQELSTLMLHEAVRIAGWFRIYWNEVQELMEAS